MKNWWHHLYSVEEMAARKKVAVATIRRRCEDGELDAVKIGRAWVIRDPEHERLCDEFDIMVVKL